MTVPSGGSAWSDPLPLTVRRGDHVAVSVYAPGAPINDHTFPPPETDTPGSFLSAAPVTPGGRIAGRPTAPSRPASCGGWTRSAPFRRPRHVVALGDSITDGYNAFGGGPRWTDVLAGRLAQLPPGRQLSVANAGISGNTVSVQPNPYDPTGQCCGPPAPQRLHRDVLSLPGLRYVLLLEGTNDLGGGTYAPPAPARRSIDAMRTIAARVHAAGRRIVGATRAADVQRRGQREGSRPGSPSTVDPRLPGRSTRCSTSTPCCATRRPDGDRVRRGGPTATTRTPKATGCLGESIDLSVFAR